MTLIHLNRITGGACESLGLRSEERTIAIGVRIGPNLMRHVTQCVNIPSAYADTGTILIGKSIMSASYVQAYYREPVPPHMRRDVGYYMDVAGWQMQDMDTPEEMELGEVLFEHYCLKGRTPEEVYGEPIRNAGS
jgi:hypothetical protein